VTPVLKPSVYDSHSARQKVELGKDEWNAQKGFPIEYFCTYIFSDCVSVHAAIFHSGLLCAVDEFVQNRE
jgi:hypothetical protein